MKQPGDENPDPDARDTRGTQDQVAWHVAPVVKRRLDQNEQNRHEPDGCRREKGRDGHCPPNQLASRHGGVPDPESPGVADGRPWPRAPKPGVHEATAEGAVMARGRRVAVGLHASADDKTAWRH